MTDTMEKPPEAQIKPKENAGVRVRTSRMFKLKDRYGKNLQIIQLKDFGFIPETIILERKTGSWFVINAVLTEEAKKKEDEELAKEKKEVEVKQ